MMGMQLREGELYACPHCGGDDLEVMLPCWAKANDQSTDQVSIDWDSEVGNSQYWFCNTCEDGDFLPDVKDLHAFDGDRAVLIAAESWEKLRRCDVDRLFGSHSDDQWTAIFKVLKEKRPDLVGEAREVMADLEADMHSTWRAE